MPVYIALKIKHDMESKTMIELNDLRSCENCSNVFLKKIGDKITNRCPACNVWKKETAL